MAGYKTWSPTTTMLICTSLCNDSLSKPAIRGVTYFSTLLSGTTITRKNKQR